MTNITSKIVDGVQVLDWNMADKSMNVITLAVMDELESYLEAALADDKIKGVVLTSTKKDLAGGADINMLTKLQDDAKASGENPAISVMAFTMRTHEVMRKIELAEKPIVVATPGTALGGAFELMLSAHHRIAADNPKAKIGLPEVMIGLFPGAGGTTRLIRMMGVMAAAPFLLEGKLVPPAKAKSAGLIDAVVPADELEKAAIEWVQNAEPKDLIKPWDAKGYKVPGGAPYTPSGFQTILGGIVMTHGKTKGVYQQTDAMLSAIYEGMQVPFDTALKVEARWFTKVVCDPRSAAMMRTLFINKQAIDKGAARPAGVKDMTVKKVGILGAGMMGAGIGFVSAKAGIEVVLIDRDQEAVDKGRASIEAILDQGIKRKKVTQEKKDQILGLVNATPDYTALKGCDLIVEAVFEDPKVKAIVTKQAEEQISEDAIFASNTSTLPITELAKASIRPDRYIGIHFFSPVHKMALVEIIKGKETGDEAVAKALDFVRQIKKTPIVVNDARYFYANRLILPYVNEGVKMLSEGVEPALIENAAKMLGFPLGPLQLTDETSLELGVNIGKVTRAAEGVSFPHSDADKVLATMVEEHNRLGRKNLAGFYEYDDKGKRQGLWPELRTLWPVADVQPALEEVQNRLMLVQSLEAVRALEEDVLLDIREGDVGAILGWGFAPWSGGPISWMDIKGADKIVEISEALEAKHGDSFTPPALLKDIAAKGESFYGRLSA